MQQNFRQTAHEMGATLALNVGVAATTLYYYIRVGVGPYVAGGGVATLAVAVAVATECFYLPCKQKFLAQKTIGG